MINELEKSVELPSGVFERFSRFRDQITNSSNSLKEYIETLSFDLPKLAESGLSIVDLIDEIQDTLNHGFNQERLDDLYNSLLNLANFNQNILEIRQRIVSDEEIDNISKNLLNILIQDLESLLSNLPVPLAPEKAAELIRKSWATKPSYGKMAGNLAEKLKVGTSNFVERILTKAAGIFNRETFGFSERLASLSGGVAFGASVFAISLLALADKAQASVGIEEVPEKDGLELKSDTGEVIKMVPLHVFDSLATNDEDNEIFNNLETVDSRVFGVNYEIVEPEIFSERVLTDARNFAQSTFSKDLEELSKLELIYTVNGIVGQRLEYDHLAIEESDSGKLTKEASEENQKISVMPIDRIYLEYGRGVCRHYAALVEACFDVLKKNISSICNMGADEIDSYDQNHAWNVFYMKIDGKTVALTYSDITIDDANGDFAFDQIDAFGGNHLSIGRTIESGLLPMTTEEQIKIYRALIDMNLGVWETNVAKNRLADKLTTNYWYEYYSEGNKSFGLESIIESIKLNMSLVNISIGVNEFTLRVAAGIRGSVYYLTDRETHTKEEITEGIDLLEKLLNVLNFKLDYNQQRDSSPLYIDFKNSRDSVEIRLEKLKDKEKRMIDGSK